MIYIMVPIHHLVEDAAELERLVFQFNTAEVSIESGIVEYSRVSLLCQKKNTRCAQPLTPQTRIFSLLIVHLRKSTIFAQHNITVLLDERGKLEDQLRFATIGLDETLLKSE
jgi:hypothetical protein